MKTRTEIFELSIDGKPVVVRATPYQTLSTETRFRVSIDDSPIYIFGWDKDLNRLTTIESSSAAGNVPATIEEAISHQLYQRMAA
ncbi:hypothetical protein HB364_05300 [Pseudoflavitalea sp. X16]|uniref:hypothetical protein n=1 Tax=Paraflavitalea devenefica TaxID=2716334 RepID=UPI0014211B1C|nr:hypothetical protein [Paraflavitalea devenefica]NII24482.1 hypothetical protein [Paraflavitalea devenefica]